MATADANDWGALDENPRPTIDNTARAQAAARTTTGQLNDRTSKVRAQFENRERAAARAVQNTRLGRTVRNTAAVGAKQLRKNTGLSAQAFARAKVSAANMWINGWVAFWYTFVQLPFAIVSTTSLGMAYAVYETITSTKVGAGLLYLSTKITGQLFQTIAEAIAGAAFVLFGINFDPFLLFIIPFALVFALGLFQMILCWFVYSMLGIKSLSGQAAAGKQLTFVLALIGIVIPFVNLFPLILLWTSVVWLKPR